MTLLSCLNQKKKAVTEKERRKSFGIGGAGNIRTAILYFINPTQHDSRIHYSL
ncbi:hypothetical protein F5Y09DRAFT_299941, partial [Xylaria sp. FL1042]